jgi:LysM repeat protein
MLKRGIEALVGAAIVVATLLAVLPAVAEAQSTATTSQARGGHGGAERSVVVAPGDSLWAISSEVLGPGATEQQIAKGVEQIYALNRDQIGPDPDLIFAGQKLSVPAMGSSAAAVNRKAKATTTAPTEREGAPTAAVTTPKRGQADHLSRVEKAPASGGETPSLPNVAEEAAPAVPEVRQAGSDNDSPVAPLLRSARSLVTSAPSAVGETLTEVRATAVSERRATLGWMVLGLTIVLGALIAWKLPMRRTTRREAESWVARSSYYGYGHYASNSSNLLMMPKAKREDREERPLYESPAGPVPAALEASGTNGSKTNGSKANGPGVKLPKVVRLALAGGATGTGLVKQRRLGRGAARGSGQTVVRKGLVTGLNSAEFHRAPRVQRSRRFRRQKPPTGGIQAARRRVSGGR